MQRPGDDHLLWRKIDSRPVYDAKIFTVRMSRRAAPDGREVEYTLVDSPDWCNVIAPVRRSDGTECLVLARQYRQGAQRITVEFPGGLVDDYEAPETAARRELEEETGYTAERLELIGRGNPNPAYMANTAFTFLAHGARRDSAQRLDENELVDVALVPAGELLDLVPPDFHVHAVMMSALHWFRLYLADGLGYEARVDRWRRSGPIGYNRPSGGGSV